MAPLTLGVFCCLILACNSLPQGNEPYGGECSRFVYEYKLMERLLKLEMELATIKERTTQAENRISKSSDHVSMKVGLIKDMGVSKGNPIKFDRIWIDTTKSYNVSDGVFVAPVSGVYMFSATICLKPKQWMAVQMLHNGVKVSFVFVGDSEWESCGSILSTQSVEVGDRVWLEKTGGSANELHESYGWNTFTANLISTA